MAVYLGTNDVNLFGGQPIASPNLQTKSESYTPSETAISDSITPDAGYDGLDEVDISISAIPSNYIGSGVTQRTSADLSASGATVTAPSGYYASNATYTVASGTAGTPTASKGAVNNHSITVTPSVTNTAGYISGGTLTGTGVIVSASELVSGTLSVTSSGTKDVTNYASASIPSGTAGTPTATKGAVSNHSVSVTPSVTNTTGFITGSTKTGTAVTVTASELVSGDKSITSNGSNIDVADYATVTVNVSGGGGASIDTKTVSNSSNTATSISFTSMKGTPIVFFVRCATQMQSGSSTYYYVSNMRYNGTNVNGNSFRMGSTRQVRVVTSGYSYTYNNNTLTLSSSGNRTTDPGSFYNGTYELTYVY